MTEMTDYIRTGHFWSSQESLGRARVAAQAIYDDPDSPVGYEPQGEEECREAVSALSERFAATGGTVAQILVNARAAARVLSDDPLQGVSEIVQNADDAGATAVRFYQAADALIAMHDGSPLTLRDVRALAAPWLTTKEPVWKPGPSPSVTGQVHLSAASHMGDFGLA